MQVKGQWINLVLYRLFYSHFENETSTLGFLARLAVLNVLYFIYLLFS